MFLLSIQRVRSVLASGRRARGRIYSRWLLTGPPMAHLETKHSHTCSALVQILQCSFWWLNASRIVFKANTWCDIMPGDLCCCDVNKHLFFLLNPTRAMLVETQHNHNMQVKTHSFVPSVGPCLPNVLMTLATVSTEGTQFSAIPSWPRSPVENIETVFFFPYPFNCTVLKVSVKNKRADLWAWAQWRLSH